MKSNLFFLFIIPCLVVPSVAYGQVQVFQDHEEEILGPGPNGTKIIKWTQSIGTNRILDNGNWVDYIFTDDVNYLQVETNGASVRLDKTSCEFSFYNNGRIGGKTPLLIDYIIPYQSVFGSGDWSTVNSIINAACNASWDGSELIAEKIAPSGIMQYVYILKNDGTWKTELRVKNESGLNDRAFGFEQVINLNRDIINFAGNQRDIDNFDKSVFDRTFLENNQGNVIDLLNGYNFDFDLGFNHLNNIWVNDTGVGSSMLTFQYTYNESILFDGDWLTIDPTWGPTGFDSVLYMRDATGANCVSHSATNTAAINAGQRDISNGNCFRGYAYWDTTSIPNTSDITSLTLDFEVASISGTAKTYSAYNMDNDPTITADATDFLDMHDGNACAFEDVQFETVGTGKQIVLSAGCVTDFQSQLTDDYFSLGFTGEDTSSPDGSDHFITLCTAACTTPLELTVEYNVIFGPGPPINPVATTDQLNQINFTWNTNNATGTVGYAVFNSSNNVTWDWLTNTANFTGDDGFYLHTGLPNSQRMWYKTSAFAASNGTNSTAVKGSTIGDPEPIVIQSVDNVGDMFKIYGTVDMSGAGVINVTSLSIRNNGTLVFTNNTKHSQEVDYKISYGPYWLPIDNDSMRNITTTVTAQSDFSTIQNESKTYKSREYQPSYRSAAEMPSIQVNYTQTRNQDQTFLHLKTNRDDYNFQQECIFLTPGEAINVREIPKDFPSGGNWVNVTNQGYYNTSVAVSPGENIYVYCYNDALLFQFISYSNSTALLAGLSGFDNILGPIFGAPLIVIFVYLIAAQANGRTAPMFIIITVAAIGILMGLGFFVIDAGMWGAIVIVAAMGVLVGRKFAG